MDISCPQRIQVALNGRILSDESQTAKQSGITPYSEITLLNTEENHLLGGMNRKKVVQLVQETEDGEDSYRRAPDDPIP